MKKPVIALVIVGFLWWGYSLAVEPFVFRVFQGGTGFSSTTPNAIIVSGNTSTGNLTASTSPTVQFLTTGYLTSTTTATSTFAGGIQLSGSGNFCLPNGTCLGAGGASLSGGTAGWLTYWTSPTAISATSSPSVTSLTVGYLTATSTATSTFAGGGSFGGLFSSNGITITGGGANFPAGSLSNTELENSSLTVTAGTGLTTGGAVSLGGSVTLNCATASGSVQGCLTAADWTTFNNKESALTFSSPLSRSVNTISIPLATGAVNGYLSSTDWGVLQNKVASTSLSATSPLGYTSATGVFTCTTCVTAVTASGNIASSGGTTPAITFTGTLPIANGGLGRVFGSTEAGVLTVSGGSIFASTSPLTIGFLTSTTTSISSFAGGVNILSGNVGIGTTTPGRTLGVQGNAVISGNLAVDGTLKTLLHKSFTYPATATSSWLGTTTLLALGPAVGETWKTAQCFTNVGSLVVQFSDGTNNMNSFQASTTIGTITFNTNNAYSAGTTRYVSIGTPASAPGYISCTLKYILTE